YSCEKFDPLNFSRVYILIKEVTPIPFSLAIFLSLSRSLGWNRIVTAPSNFCFSWRAAGVNSSSGISVKSVTSCVSQKRASSSYDLNGGSCSNLLLVIFITLLSAGGSCRHYVIRLVGPP